MKCYEIKAKADVSEIWLYEEIGFWGVGAKDFMAELSAITSRKIDLHINSPGGEVFDGIAIYNGVKNHPAKVTTYIDGIAASIASVIALAGDTVSMAENAMFMMHNPMGLCMGESADMRKIADSLDKIRDSMVGVYVANSEKTQAEIIAMLDEESWLNADEAEAAGFVDEVTGKKDLTACAKFLPVMEKLGFKHIPKDLDGKPTVPSVRDLERVLRDAGCTARLAKTILAKGYADGSRDDEPVSAPQVTAPTRDAARTGPAGRDRYSELYVRAERLVPSP